jgi:hypothetical protein
MPEEHDPSASPAPQPAHLYEAVAGQRDRVLGAFDTQRAAILKAVADQRKAALAPIRNVQARKAGVPPGAAGRPAGAASFSHQQLVAADIVLTLKAMIADEVRAQLAALLEAADSRGRAAAGDTANQPS